MSDRLEETLTREQYERLVEGFPEAPRRAVANWLEHGVNSARRLDNNVIMTRPDWGTRGLVRVVTKAGIDRLEKGVKFGYHL